MAKFKPGVAFGNEAWDLLNEAKAKNAALPAVNVTGTNSVNATLETARAVNSPVIIQFSNGGAVFYAGKGMPNENHSAAIKGAREIGFAIVAMTLTLVAVYAPLAFTPGRTGRLFVEFALALAGAVVVSGFVALTLSPEGDGVTIMVTDTGKGIAADVLERLGREQLTTKAVGPGTGLGVMMTRTLVERAGGRFQLTSTVGSGTVARVWLPRIDAPKATA